MKQLDLARIFATDRPSPKLLTLYLLRSLAFGPLFFVVFPVLWFRYVSLRYRFDEEGIHMRWGVVFRNEINLTYVRIQDIHLRSGLLQRWLGLADVLLQTASGSASAEMTLEGLVEYEGFRDFLYAKMRGHDAHPPAGQAAARGSAAASGADPAVARELHALREELVRTRVALERLALKGREP